jgi:hypothetical protein
MNIQRRMHTLLRETSEPEWRDLSKDRHIIAHATHLPYVDNPEFSALRPAVPTRGIVEHSSSVSKANFGAR